MAASSAQIPLSSPVATALLSSAHTERRTGFSSVPLLANQKTWHCYQSPLTRSSSLLQGCSFAGFRPLPFLARGRRSLEATLLPATRLGCRARVPNPRKILSCLAPVQGTWESDSFKEWGRKEEKLDGAETERPDMAGRLADTGPPSTSASTRPSASQQGYVNHRGLGLQRCSAFSQRESRLAGVAFPGWGERGEKAPRSCRASAARKTATFESPAEVDFRALQEIAGGVDVGNGPRRVRSRRTVIDEEEGVPSERSLTMREEVKGATSGLHGSGSANGGGFEGAIEGGVNGVDVNGAPKRRRRATTAGNESTAKRSVVRRKRTSKLVEDAKPGDQPADASGELGASDSDSEALAAVGTANGAGANGAKGVGADVNRVSVNGAIATESGVNGRKRAVRRRKAVETDSEDESEAFVRGGKQSELDGEVEGLKTGVNGQRKPVRRRRRPVKEAVSSDAETDGLRSSGEESDGFSDILLDDSSQNGHEKVEMLSSTSAREGIYDEIGGDSEEDSDPPETEVGYGLPPSRSANAPVPSKPLLPPPKPTRKAPEPRSRTPKSPASFVKEKLRQGLAVVSGNAGADGEIDNSIDPHRLVRGELVVHKRVGIGRFRELRTEKVEGRAQPVLFVYLEYADGLAKLPAHQAHRLLYRYRSPGLEGKEPGLSKLKDRRAWERRKSKGRAHIQKMVINILKLYRLRAAVSRSPYPPDGEAQARFESTFSYEPTEHQQQAFDAVRDDMCNRRVPMDRIVCGDVGFGKTEVALRAVFRAANAGRQVAVLAPTTVLAKQHYDVIRERFKDFPEITVTMLSRLAGEKEKRAGLEGIANGEVDVAVGTHALLGESVRFKDLGLLVVDEEQRFGVRQKEKMKNMKTEIDVLTLSATPIPRTLEQATRGLKDLSLITTPPPSRRPIKTHLQQFDEKLVEWAIEQELERGGQVYYIVPRIHGGKTVYSQSIMDVQEELKRKMPDVTVDMAHGQMSGPELERAMRAFRAGQTQILLCTSIVESGLDIPNCNTIIITEVEKFGLAQIYQLRGRVGRSNVEAHAYLLYSVGNREELSPPAELRLQALEECVDLGAGVHVAQRDLTIRGTGEVFGEKQSGKLSTEIGADLFNEMLFDSLYRAQTETLPKVHFDDVKVDFVVDTLVPHDYIDCTEGRDQFLKDMEKAARGGVESANDFYLEMEERLGPPPPGAKRRLQMLVMKRLAADLGITRIRTRPKFILFETSMSIGAFQMLFDAIDEEKAVDIKNNLIYKEGSAGFLLKSLLGLPPEKEAQDAFECLMEMSKGLDSFMNLDRSADS